MEKALALVAFGLIGMGAILALLLMVAFTLKAFV